MRLSVIALCCAAVLLAACSHSGEDADFRSVDFHGWAYGDTLSFTPCSEKTSTLGRLAVVVRHSASYVYSNLWLEITVPPAAGDTVGFVDTLNIRLADDSGNLLGRGSGMSVVKIDTLPEHFLLDASKNVTLRHIMRVDTLEGIEQAGILFLAK